MSIVLCGIWLVMVGTEILLMRYSPKSEILRRGSLFFWVSFYVLMPLTLWPVLDDDYYILTWRYPAAAVNSALFSFLYYLIT